MKRVGAPISSWWACVYTTGSEPPTTGHSGFISDDDWEIDDNDAVGDSQA